jgi:hypothetical protein
MAGLIFSFFFEIFLIIGLISSSSRSSVKTMIFLLSSTQWFFSLSTISLEFIEDLSWNKSKNVWCNVWRLDNMHASLVWNIGPPLFDAPLFAIRSLPCFSVPSHSCASHPFNFKCSVYRRLSAMITALVAYQAWPCPPSLVLLDSSWMSLANHSSSGFS